MTRTEHVRVGAFVSNERSVEPFIFIVAGVKLFPRGRGHLRGLFISHYAANVAALAFPNDVRA